MSVVVLGCASGSAVVTCGDVPTGGLSTICIEGWFRVSAISTANRPLVMKYGASGHDWALYVTRDGRFYFVAFVAAGVNAAYSAAGAITYTRWVHVAGCYDGADCKVFLNGSDVTAASRLSGGVVADTAQDVTLGGYIGEASAGFMGRIGWCRVSDVCRYAGAPAGPDAPPAVDGHTLAQWNLSEGAGLVTDNATGVSAYDGQITGASWAQSEAGDKVHARPTGLGWWSRPAQAVLRLGVGNHG